MLLQVDHTVIMYLVDPEGQFVDYYGHLSRADLIKLAAWDREHNAGRLIQPWLPCEHPQLGPVEVGGIDSRVGYWNPPPELLGELCAQQSACFVRVAAMAGRRSLSGNSLNCRN